MLKEYLEINVKNDEQLVKLATIEQRLATASKQGSEEEFGLSEKEKEQLMKEIDHTVQELQDHSDDITAKINN